LNYLNGWPWCLNHDVVKVLLDLDSVEKNLVPKQVKLRPAQSLQSMLKHNRTLLLSTFHCLIVAFLVIMLFLKPLSKARLHLLLCLKTNLAVILICHVVVEVPAIDEWEHASVLCFVVFEERQQSVMHYINTSGTCRFTDILMNLFDLIILKFKQVLPVVLSNYPIKRLTNRRMQQYRQRLSHELRLARCICLLPLQPIHVAFNCRKRSLGGFASLDPPLKVVHLLLIKLGLRIQFLNGSINLALY